MLNSRLILLLIFLAMLAPVWGQDTITPTARCQNITVRLDNDEQLTLTPASINHGSSDNITVIPSLAVAPNTFDCSSLGSNNHVMLTVTDAAGNTATCIGIVTVKDPPIALCQDITVQLDASGQIQIMESDIDAGSSDNCGSITSMATSPSTFDCSALGLRPEWKELGGKGISVGSAYYQSMAIAPDGTPYVAYLDIFNRRKTTVLRWNGITWSPLGSTGISAGMAAYQSLAIAPDGTPYVAYLDVVNGLKTTVLRWDGSNWNPLVGNALRGPGISAGFATFQSLAIAPDGTPYVAYRDYTDGYKTTVLWWDGSNWNPLVGNALTGPGISAGSATFQSLAIAPDGTPYVAYRDHTDGYKTTVLKWDGSNWTSLGGTVSGGPGISAGPTLYQSMAIAPNGTPYVAYEDISNDYKTTVLKWDGSNWTPLVGNTSPGPGISEGRAFHQSLVIAPGGTPYVAYTDVPNDSKTTVLRWDGGDWTLMGEIDSVASSNPGAPEYFQSMAIAPNGSLYVAYMDGSTTFFPSQTTVLQWIGDNFTTLSVTDSEGNNNDCKAWVNVENGTLAAVCTPLTVQLDASGDGSLAASQIDGGSSNSCGSFSLVASPNTFDCSAVGQNNPVTLTVTDHVGNTVNCIATVTVEDNDSPTARCANYTVLLDATGNGVLSANQIDGGSSDPCGILSMDVSTSTFDCSSIGANNHVTLTVTDNSRNTASCSTLVTVEDKVVSAALCTSYTVQLDASGNGSITAAQIDGGSSDACGPISLNASINAFDCSAVGLSNSVTLTVTDVVGNTASCNAVVAVEDNIAPTPLCQNATVVLSPLDGTGAIISTDIDASSNDACGIGSLDVAPSSFDCSMVGDNTVTLTVTDQNGNTSNCTGNVSVDDSQSKPDMLAQQSCGNCGQIRIFYCQFDANPASLNEFIDGTTATNANFVAGNGLFWYNDNGGSPGTEYNRTGQEPAAPNMNLGNSTYWYWVSQIDQNTGCIGDPIRVRVRVRKTPTPVFNAPATPFCEGAQVNFANLVDDPNSVADHFDFYDGDPAVNGVLLGSVTATNGTVDPGQAVVIRPGPGNKTFWVVATNQGNNNSITCPATTNMSFVVSPKPVVTPISDVTKCPGEGVSVNFTSTPSGLFVWVNSNTDIGLGTNGFNSINFTTGANTSGTPLVGTISVRAIANNCISTIETFNITVNSDAVVDPISNVTVCSDQPIGMSLMTIVGSPAAASYELLSVSLDPGLSANVTNQGPATGLAMNAFANDIFTNPSSAPLTATYYLRAITATNCNSDIQTVTATILPDVIVTPGLKDTVCSGQTTNLVLSTTNALPGTSFSWSPKSLPAGITLVSTTSPGTTLADVLVNNTSSPIDVIYDVTASAGNCTSVITNVRIRVVPFPATPSTASIDACEDPNTAGVATFDLTSLDVAIGSGRAVNYFTDPNLLNQIGTTGAFISGSTTVYASVVNPGVTCPNRTDITLTVIRLAQPVINNAISLCSNTPQIIEPTPIIGISFNFYDNDPDNGGLVVGSGSFYDPMLAGGQSQTIWITATDGVCESQAVQVLVTVNSAPIAVASALLSNGVLCIGDTLELFGSGMGTYSWSGPNSFTSNLQYPVRNGVVFADSGDYILTITNNGGCSDMDTVHISIDSISNPGGNGFLTIAANAQPEDLFDYLTGNPDRGGIWAGPSAPYNGDNGTFNPNFMSSGVYSYTLTNPRGCRDSISFATVTVNVTPITAAKVRAKVFLEGVLDTTNLLMKDSLRLAAFMPTNEPYTQLGYTHVNGGGNESFAVAQLNNTGVNALVDWVYIELRSSSDNTHIVATRSALLQRDGDVVDLDGISPVCFNRVISGFYYVVIGHRNHLAVMTSIPIFLNNSGTISLDFTSGVLGVFGTAPQNVNATSLITGGVNVMIGGDADFNGQIQNTDDVVYWSSSVGGAGYLRADYDCDGQVQNNDRVFIWSPNVGKGTQVPVRSN